MCCVMPENQTNGCQGVTIFAPATKGICRSQHLNIWPCPSSLAIQQSHAYEATPCKASGHGRLFVRLPYNKVRCWTFSPGLASASRYFLEGRKRRTWSLLWATAGKLCQKLCQQHVTKARLQVLAVPWGTYLDRRQRR